MSETCIHFSEIICRDLTVWNKRVELWHPNEERKTHTGLRISRKRKPLTRLVSCVTKRVFSFGMKSRGSSLKELAS